MRTVLITGGSRGIGAAMVRLFSDRGYRVAFTYKNSAAAASLISEETGALAIRADSASEKDICNAVKTAEEKIGNVELATSSFGQGNSVTPIQLVNAANAAVNGGVLNKPYILKGFGFPDTNTIILRKEKTNGKNRQRRRMEAKKEK